MRHYIDIQTVQKQLSEITCDICGKKYSTDKDWQEIQEFVHIAFVGGYGSIFGDGEKYECDICQHCLKRLLGKYLRLTKELLFLERQQDE